MATKKATTKKRLAKRPPRANAVAATVVVAPARREGKTDASGLILRPAEGPEPAEGFRRFACPNCGRRHDVHLEGGRTPGTWSVAFTCTSCEVQIPSFPVT